MPEKKKLPIGIEDFGEILKERFYYVDKTEFIAELLRSWGKVNLITRPRRFGKSLNMSMLRYFFEIGCDPSVFEGLQITREKDLCEEYMGQFPVISITLKEVEGADYETAFRRLIDVIGTEAERFSFLADSTQLSENDKQKYQALTELKNGCYTMDEVIATASLRTLSMLLSKHYKRQIILLVDEYDVPLDKAFQCGYYDEMLRLVRSFLGSVLKTNEYLKFAVLTGCLRISKESIFTGPNNFNVMSITDRYFETSFGFTDDDVRELLAYYGLEFSYETIRQWYDGYCFGQAFLYCPWDVLKYVQALLVNRDAEPENYWANTSGNTMVRRFIDKANQQTRMEMEQLIAGEAIQKTLNLEMTYNELDTSIENLWSVLFTTGYLTKRSRIGSSTFSLVIPNREIRELFLIQIREWFRDTTRKDPTKIGAFCDAFPEGRASLIEEMLNDYLWKSISIRETFVQKNQKENFYHGMLLGLLQYEDGWLIKSNAESGEGFSDILLETPKRTGVVIEIKYAEKGFMEEGCRKALEQIEKKQYASRLEEDGMTKILKYGIAFYKKHCKVVLG